MGCDIMLYASMDYMKTQMSCYLETAKYKDSFTFLKWLKPPKYMKGMISSWTTFLVLILFFY